MCRRESILFAWLLLFGTVLPAAALELDFQASVNRTRSGEADPIQLTLTLRSDENISHLPAPEISLKEFYAEGPAVSTRMEMVNFETNFTRVLTYTLHPRRTGKITIGPARLRFDNQVFQTKPITVEIVKGSTRRVPRSSSDSPQSQDAGIEENLFLLARADREKAYVGQQITVDYDLFYRFRLENVGFKEIPTFAGFWTKEIFVAQQLAAHRETIEGVAFNAAPLRRMGLFPTSAGTHRVEPMVISCDIPQRRGRRGGLLDDFVFGRATKAVLVRSEGLEFEVLPWPEKGRPEGFNGAVGQFTLKVKAQPTSLPVGDPVTLRIEIAGRGNLEAIKLPVISAVPGIKVYDPKVEEEDKVENGLYGGRRTYEYILIPEGGGMLEVAPIRFAYFDPDLERYQLIESEPIYINSQGSVAEKEQESYGLSRKDIQEVGQDIRYIKPDVAELGGSVVLYRSALFWTLQGMLPLAFLGLLFYQRHQQRLEGDVAYARRRRARGEAGRRLKQGEQLLEEGKGVEFHAEIQRAVLTFLADRLNLAAAGLTVDTSARTLEEKGVDEELVSGLRDLLVQCDFARFAQVASGRREMEELHARAEQLITSLEKVI